MGSLRNPVGPLPSTIYWRRRAVALCLIALLALLALWVLASGDGGGKKANDAANGSAPAPSITPGPAGTGPAISQQPGGRDESGDSGDAGESGTGDGPGSGSGSDAGSGAGTDAGTGDGSGPAGSGAGGKNGDTDGAGDGGAGRRVPAGSPLPNCPLASLELALSSAKLTYEPGEKPRFHLAVKNTSDTDCKADLGPRTAVLKIIGTPQSDRLWASDDCPRPGDPVLLKVPARTTITHTVEWDLRRSAPRCATAPAGEAAPGNYLVEATVAGSRPVAAPFALAKD
ncbi:hypothetical protein [Streptomyces omiyaensis]|uniref:DUF4232 domain-containing protein n=1 Tax=Streptomyces omiyaensis TaxID=68247 RepID=A0ABW7BUR6_9ACTN|nr:hypothetical protein [Streptomyces omiyaensis]GGY44550.1 hypothetical protein GCM10010363_26860 [Streptomyces omiyaensis]